MRYESLKLFVVEIRKGESRLAERPLTGLERLVGWREVAPSGGGPAIQVNSRSAASGGHATHLLCWEVLPGETVTAMLHGGAGHAEDDSDGASEAEVRTYVDGARFGELFRLRFVSAPAESAMLGDDNFSERFGHDALADHLRAYLRGDRRRTPCVCEAVEGKAPNEVTVTVPVAALSWRRED